MSTIPLDFQQTDLWQDTFVKPRQDATEDEQNFFKTQLLAVREKAKHLVDQIPKDMPGMTVHDVTHLDALWETASIASGGALNLNPAEGFVFGASILLHDSAMSVAAYPRGLEEIAETTTWKDAVAQRFDIVDAASFDPKHMEKSRIEAVLPNVLRRLHAPQAEKLATQYWTTAANEQEFLIAEGEVRSFYGPTIGKIAHSHWWNTQKIEQELAQDLGALPGRTRNVVDKIKIACLLRIADALHLDRLRAPPFLRTLARPEGASIAHWAFQEKLARPHLKDGTVVYTTGSPFEKQDAEAWWLAHDFLVSVDQELRDVDILLQGRRRGTLNAKRVNGIESPEALARSVETSGWRPVDARIKATDVSRIVETLGGSKLYGNDPSVPLRELIQNGADAIQARRRLEGRADDWGQISVSINTDSRGKWLVVEDNGIGMSEAVVTGALLNFGTSFWRSAAAAEEFPGLAASGMKAIGRFGIGFFSIFMLGRIVRVTTRRFDNGVGSARVLEMTGPSGRPIIWPATAQEAPLDGGTRVEVLLTDDPYQQGGLLWPSSNYSDKAQKLDRVVHSLAPNLDVKIVCRQESQPSVILNPSDWLSVSGEDLWNRMQPSRINQKPSPFAANIRTLSNGERVFGRAAISSSSFSFETGGWITVSGLRATGLRHIEGIFTGVPLTVSRNLAQPEVPPEVLAAWASEQAKLVAKMKIPDGDKARVAEVVLQLGGDIASLPVARLNGEWLTKNKLRKALKDRDEVVIHFDDDVSFDSDEDDLSPRYFADHFQESADVFFVPERSGNVLRGTGVPWPKSVEGKSNLRLLVEGELAHLWKNGSSVESGSGVVGEAGITEIYRDVEVYREAERED